MDLRTPTHDRRKGKGGVSQVGKLATGHHHSSMACLSARTGRGGALLGCQVAASCIAQHHRVFVPPEATTRPYFTRYLNTSLALYHQRFITPVDCVCFLGRR